MLLRIISTVIIFFALCPLKAQSVSYDPNTPPSTFQSVDNPYYWRNNAQSYDYWQQDVHYKMNITLDEEKDIILGNAGLRYFNNSPDTLYEVYFHLYQNAFQPGSYLDDLYKNNGVKPKYGKYEEAGLGTTVENFKVDGFLHDTELDNTIMRVKLLKPMPPNTSVLFTYRFKSYYGEGGVRRRMKKFKTYGFTQYNAAHWYPRISVYDRKFGWTTDQHFGREFYGDFGTFDVTLNFPSNYIVEATGTLQNFDEVYPDDLREKVDIKNFADKPWGEKPSEIIPYTKGERKKWHFYAENVHDFAWIANPIFRVGETEWNGIKCVAVVQEPHAGKWQNAADYTAKIIEVFSRDFGMYAYPKMIVSDAKDGMEYPMLTMDNGKDPTYRGLLVHEVGHNWFYGMVGNNETYRAALDEGFTQFLTAWGLEDIDGKYPARDSSKWKYVEKFRLDIPSRDGRVYNGYMRDAIKHNDPRLNTHSDHFGGKLRHGGGYRHVYSKTATMLYNLQYVLGDSLFLAAMQNYFEEWKMKHPYFEDFRQSVIDFARVDLNWFFDQWLESTESIDYRIKSIRKRKGLNDYEITFKRKGGMEMPIDFSVFDRNGSRYDYHIPNRWFEKETDATILPKWHGWDNINKTYTVDVSLEDALYDIVIDTSGRLADINPLDNAGLKPRKMHFDARIKHGTDWRKEHVYGRPAIWYNSYDGLKLGYHQHGHYMKYKHIYNFNFWVNTRWGQGGFDEFDDEQSKLNNPVSFTFSYKNHIDKLFKNTNWFVRGKFLDGLSDLKIGLNKKITDKVTAGIYGKAFFRRNESDLNYLLYPEEWESGKLNSSVNAFIKHHWQKGKVRGHGLVEGRSSSLLSDYDYHQIKLTVRNDVSHKKVKLKTRVHGQFGSGKDQAIESALYFAGGNPESMMDEKLLRSKAVVPPEWAGSYGPETGHFHVGGGLNMRGYNNYFLVETDEFGQTAPAYRGQTGGSINLELEFDKIFLPTALKKKWLTDRFRLKTYLFGDIGAISYKNSIGEDDISTIRSDAGFGAALTIKKWFIFNELKPMTFRFDFPVYLSHAPAGEENIQFRWLVGLNRAF